MTIDIEKLRECPFCGQEPKRNGRHGIGGVVCSGRDHRVQSYGATQQEADSRWNTRVSETALLERIEGLTGALADIFEHFSGIDQAPGHHHTMPGIWDKDISNGALGGQTCDWCAKWEAACTALSKGKGNG